MPPEPSLAQQGAAPWGSAPTFPAQVKRPIGSSLTKLPSPSLLSSPENAVLALSRTPVIWLSPSVSWLEAWSTPSMRLSTPSLSLLTAASSSESKTVARQGLGVSSSYRARGFKPQAGNMPHAAPNLRCGRAAGERVHNRSASADC